jgi:ankyrin repeat protein
MQAAVNGPISILKYLILQQPCDVNATDSEGRTALMLASICGFSYNVELLLMKGANPNVQDMVGYFDMSISAVLFKCV